MADNVEIVFVARGVREALGAFDSIETRIKRLAQQEASSADAGARATERGEAAKRRSMTETEKLALRVARDQDKATEREATRREQIVRRSSEMAGKYAEQEAKATERAEREKTRSLEREAARREAIVRRSSEMAGRYAAQQARAEEQVHRAEAAHRERMSRLMGGTATRSLGGMVSSGVGLASMALTVGGGFAIADAGRNLLASERNAVALMNSAQIAGMPLSKASIMDTVGKTQAATNISKNDLLKGWQQYVKISSDVQGGQENLGEFAKLAKATGTDFGEMMTLAGRLKSGNAGLSSKDQLSLLRNIIGQGGQGSIEVEDLAKVGGEIVATAGMYGGPVSRSQQRLLGLAQIPGKLFGAAESATAVQRFGQDLEANADLIGSTGAHFNRRSGTVVQGLGVKVKDANGQLRDPAEIVSELMRASGGDLGKLKAGGLGKESMKIFEGVLSTFQQAGGGATGAEAVRTKIAQVENAGATSEDVDQMFARVMSESSEKFANAVNKIEESIQAHIGPALDRFADKIPELLPKIEMLINGVAKVADFFMENPFTGIGAVIAAKVTADVGQAALGKVLADGLAKAFSGGIGGGAPVSLPGGGTGKGSGTGAVGGGVAIAGALAEVYGLTEGDDAVKAARQKAAAGGGYTDVIKSGAIKGLTTGPLGAAQDIYHLIQQERDGGPAKTLQKIGGPPAGYAEMMKAMWAGEGGGPQAGGAAPPGASKQNQQAQATAAALKANEDASKGLASAMTTLTANAKTAADALAKVKGPAGGSGDAPPPPKTL